MNQAVDLAPFAKWLRSLIKLNGHGLTEQTVQAYVKYVTYELAQTRPTAFLLRDLSYKSKMVRLAAMRRYAEFTKNEALAAQLTRLSVAKAVGSKATRPVSHSKQLEEHEIRAFLNALDEWKDRNPLWVWPCLGVLYHLALRAGSDLLSITRKDIETGLDSGQIPIWTKGEKYRFLPADMAREQLEALLALPGWDTLVELVSPGKAPNRNSAYTMITLACKAVAGRAGLEPERMHTHRLRHTRAMELYEDSGHDIHLVQQFLGHSSIATTQIYLQSNRTMAMSSALKRRDESRKG